MGNLIFLGVGFWAAVLGGGFYFVWRYVRAVERRGGQGEIQAAVERRLAAVEEAMESVRNDMERLERGQEFTTRLLSESVRPTQSPSR